MVQIGIRREGVDAKRADEFARIGRRWAVAQWLGVACALLTLASIKLLPLVGSTLWAAILLALSATVVALLAHQSQRLLRQVAAHPPLPPQSFADADAVVRGSASASTGSQEAGQNLALPEFPRLDLMSLVVPSFVHDINNVLSVVQGAAEMIGFSVPPNHEMQTDLGAIRQAVAQLTDLNQQLLNGSRLASDNTPGCSPAELLRKLEPALKRIVGRRTQLSIELGNDCSPIQTTTQEFAQILLHLVVNAKDAAGTQGTIRIAISNTAEDAVVLMVEDDGKGIEPPIGNLDRGDSDEPASGNERVDLGISAVKVMVWHLGGRVELASPTGQSRSHVAVYFPKAKDQRMIANDTTRFTNGTAPNVLVLDDEETVRRLLVRILTREGYNVLESSTIAEALQKAKSVERLDVWLTDANLEGSDATTEIPAMQMLHPQVAIVLISGREPDADRMETLTAQGVRFLGKPFGPADLRQTIEEAIQGRSATSVVLPLVEGSTSRSGRQAP